MSRENGILKKVLHSLMWLKKHTQLKRRELRAEWGLHAPSPHVCEWFLERSVSLTELRDCSPWLGSMLSSESKLQK